MFIIRDLATMQLLRGTWEDSMKRSRNFVNKIEYNFQTYIFLQTSVCIFIKQQPYTTESDLVFKKFDVIKSFEQNFCLKKKGAIILKKTNLKKKNKIR